MFNYSEEHYVFFDDDELLAAVRETLQELYESTFTSDKEGDGRHEASFAIRVDRKPATAWIHGITTKQERTLLDGRIAAHATVDNERFEFTIEICSPPPASASSDYMFLMNTRSCKPYPA